MIGRLHSQATVQAIMCGPQACDSAKKRADSHGGFACAEVKSDSRLSGVCGPQANAGDER